MRKAILNVSTGRYLAGQERLRRASAAIAPDAELMFWADCLPPGSPNHSEVPYAFKPYAIAEAQRAGVDLVLWADASILPIAALDPIWNRAVDAGVWLSDNGWANGQWCSDAALPLLGITRQEAMDQKHVVATAFALDLRSDQGKRFVSEYLRFAMNGAFRGPWKNEGGSASADARVLGHRHDQTAASVIAARLGIALTQPPAFFAYAGGQSAETVLLADGIC